MAEEILSMAVLEALPGKEEELLSNLRELYTMMHAEATAGIRCIATPCARSSCTSVSGLRPKCEPKPRLILKFIAIVACFR